MTRNTRPVWLGPDVGRWDHVRLHVDLFADARLGAYEIAVLAALTKHGNAQTGECHPSVKTIAGYLKLNEKTVRRCIERLEEIDYLRVNRAKGKVSRYYLIAPPSADSGTAVVEKIEGSADSGTGHRGQSARTTADSGTDELEPTMKIKNKPRPNLYSSLGVSSDEIPELDQQHPTTPKDDPNRTEPSRARTEFANLKSLIQPG